MTESTSITSPEKLLALAVIEKAVKDYKRGRLSAKRFLFPDDGDNSMMAYLWTQLAEVSLYSIQKRLKDEG